MLYLTYTCKISGERSGGNADLFVRWFRERYSKVETLFEQLCRKAKTGFWTDRFFLGRGIARRFFSSPKKARTNIFGYFHGGNQRHGRSKTTAEHGLSGRHHFHYLFFGARRWQLWGKRSLLSAKAIWPQPLWKCHGTVRFIAAKSAAAFFVYD